jgi:MFS family permease
MARQDHGFSEKPTLPDSKESTTPGSSPGKRRISIRHLSSKEWFIIGLLGSAISVALQGAWLNIATLSLFRMVFGFFNGMVTVNGNILTAQSVSRDFRSRAFGVLNAVLPLGSVTGPVIGGALGDSLGLGISFFASSGVFLLAAGAFVLLEKHFRDAE